MQPHLQAVRCAKERVIWGLGALPFTFSGLNKGRCKDLSSVSEPPEFTYGFVGLSSAPSLAKSCQYSCLSGCMLAF